MEHFWDLLFKLMKHGTSTLHVVFIFLFIIDDITKMTAGERHVPSTNPLYHTEPH
jgi:hypothetical protein